MKVYYLNIETKQTNFENKKISFLSKFELSKIDEHGRIESPKYNLEFDKLYIFEMNVDLINSIFEELNNLDEMLTIVYVKNFNRLFPLFQNFNFCRENFNNDNLIVKYNKTLDSKEVLQCGIGRILFKNLENLTNGDICQICKYIKDNRFNSLKVITSGNNLNKQIFNKLDFKLSKWLENQYISINSNYPLSFLYQFNLYGVLFINPNYQFLPQQNILIADIESSYPFQLLNRKYPQTLTECDKLSALNIIESDLTKFENDFASRFLFSIYPVKKYIFGKFRIKNLKYKKGRIPFLNSSDILELNGVKKQLNNNVLECDSFCINCTNVFFISLSASYDFEIDDIIFCFVSENEKLDFSYRRKTVNELLKLKKTDKSIKGFLNSYAFGSCVKGKNYTKTEYDIKNNIFLSKPLGDDIPLNKDGNLCCGILIRDYGILHLMAFQEWIKKECPEDVIIYADTDALHLKAFDENRTKKAVNRFNYEFSRFHNIKLCGSFKFNFYKNVTYLQYKSYFILTDKNELKVKCSGLAKPAQKLLSDLYDVCKNSMNFEEFCCNFIHPNAIITSQKDLQKTYYSYTGHTGSYHFNGRTLYSGLIKIPTKFELYSLSNFLSAQYFLNWKIDNFDKNVNMEITTISEKTIDKFKK